VNSKEINSDFLIIGAGIIGLSIAKELKKVYPTKKINIIEKESEVGLHSSGRNSGVLHSGFYYTANSLKAKFTKEGNKELKDYCLAQDIPINFSKKVVVVNDEDELESLYELNKRGKANGVDVTIIDQQELAEIDPNIKTYEKALFSPDTVTIQPKSIVLALKNSLLKSEVNMFFDTSYVEKINSNSINTTKGYFCADTIINCAGLYADKIAKEFDFSNDYTILPFKGVYLKYSGDSPTVRTNVYPVPNLKNPFLGVHFTITGDNTLKIGPTAIPAFSRENYSLLGGLKMKELIEILRYDTKLFISNAFNFRELALSEFKKYNKSHLIDLASKMVRTIDAKGFNQWSKPGIRAQLLNINSLELVQDFVVEGDDQSVHVLNAVSPAFTSSFPFAKWIVKNYISV